MKRINDFIDSALEVALRFLNRYMANKGLALGLNLYSQYTFDKDLLLKAAALIPESANGTLELDVGVGLVNADLVIDVTALEIANNDEAYTVLLEGTNTAGFGTAADNFLLAMMPIGDKVGTAPALYNPGTDDAIGRYVVPCRNERNGTTYRYLRLRFIVTGTIATGINLTAFLAKR